MIPILAAVLLSTMSQATPVAAQQNCKSLEGEFVARAVQPPAGPEGSLCTAGQLSGGLKGKYEFHITKSPVDAGTPAPGTVKFFVGQSTVTLKNGDVIVGIDTGTIDMPPGAGGFASLITWTQGATGQIRLNGHFDAAAGTTSGEYEGTVCKRR